MIKKIKTNTKLTIIFISFLVLLSCERRNPSEVDTEETVKQEEIGYSPNIVFVSTRDSIYSSHNELGTRGEIYGMNITGKNQRRLTFLNSIDNCRPVFSPDGCRIAFVSFNDQSTPNIYIMDNDGGNVLNLTSEEFWCDYPHFFPDGSAIVYLDNYRNIWVMHSDGSHHKQLTHSESNFIIDISEDGKEILFNSERDGNSEIYLMDILTMNKMNLTNCKEHDYGAQFFSNDEQILFYSKRTGISQIFKMKKDGSEVVQLTEQGGNGYCQISPVGDHIVFESWRDGNTEIYIMNIDGNSEKRLTNHPATDERPVFTLDGKKIIFESNRTDKYQIFSIDNDGQNLINISNSIDWDFDHDVFNKTAK